jgi:hypothetical protein
MRKDRRTRADPLDRRASHPFAIFGPARAELADLHAGHPPSALSFLRYCRLSYDDRRPCRWKERNFLKLAGGESQEGCPEQCQGKRRAPGTA